MFESSQRDGLLVELLSVFVHSLTVVTHGKQLWYFGRTPDCEDLLSDGWLRVSFLRSWVVIVVTRVLVVELCGDI